MQGRSKGLANRAAFRGAKPQQELRRYWNNLKYGAGKARSSHGK